MGLIFLSSPMAGSVARNHEEYIPEVPAGLLKSLQEKSPAVKAKSVAPKEQKEAAPQETAELMGPNGKMGKWGVERKKGMVLLTSKDGRTTLEYPAAEYQAILETQERAKKLEQYFRPFVDVATSASGNTEEQTDREKALAKFLEKNKGGILEYAAALVKHHDVPEAMAVGIAVADAEKIDFENLGQAINSIILDRFPKGENAKEEESSENKILRAKSKLAHVLNTYRRVAEGKTLYPDGENAKSREANLRLDFVDDQEAQSILIDGKVDLDTTEELAVVTARCEADRRKALDLIHSEKATIEEFEAMTKTMLQDIMALRSVQARDILYPMRKRKTVSETAATVPSAPERVRTPEVPMEEEITEVNPAIYQKTVKSAPQRKVTPRPRPAATPERVESSVSPDAETEVAVEEKPNVFSQVVSAFSKLLGG